MCASMYCDIVIRIYCFTDPRIKQMDRSFYDAPVILNNIVCIGSQQSFNDCSSMEYGYFPNCSDIAHVICEGIHIHGMISDICA